LIASQNILGFWRLASFDFDYAIPNLDARYPNTRSEHRFDRGSHITLPEGAVATGHSWNLTDLPARHMVMTPKARKLSREK
jgi:hypothetical protein